MITEEALRERLKQLEAHRENLVGQVNAVGGAIQECEYWIGELTKDEEEEFEGTSDGPAFVGESTTDA